MGVSNVVCCSFPVLMMHCVMCAARVERALRAERGVRSAVVNFAAATVSVSYDAAETGPERLRAAVRAVGYDLVTVGGADGDKQQADADERLRRRTVLAAALSVPVLILCMVAPHNSIAVAVAGVLATPVVLIIGRDFHVHAYKELKARCAGMDTLVSISTLTAYLFSCFNILFPTFLAAHGIEPHAYFESAALIITFVLLGRALEAHAKSDTNAAVRSLIALRPLKATIVGADGKPQEIKVDEIVQGQTLIIRPGERIPADGVVSNGSSYVDESMMTGEPMPAAKQKGSHAYAGTLNLNGALRITAQQTGGNTLLAQIIQMVNEAQGTKAPIQRLADRIAAVFVPLVTLAALAALILWLTLGGTAAAPHAVVAFITVLIIACPCALGLATPAAITVAIGRAAQEGILIRNAESIQTAAKADTIVLDKTGTVTQGRPQVTTLIWDDPHTAAPGILYSLEAHSQHPLAQAITTHLNTTPHPISHFQEQPGTGVKATANGITYYACNENTILTKHIPISPKLQAAATQLQHTGHTLVFFATNHHTLALIALKDTIRPNTHNAIQQLKKLHLKVHLLTGDNHNTATTIAKQIGADHCHANATPLNKANYIQHLQNQHHCVGMTGDGINDSAALAQANLSIALAQGSHIAIQTAQVTILTPDLTKLPTLITLARHTNTIIHQNLFWAFAYNTLAIPIAAGALQPLCQLTLTPTTAAITMTLSSLTVTLNSLRIKHLKNTKNKTMKKQYKIEGMMCNHCRTRVEQLLNQNPNLHATVTLTPPIATIETTLNTIPLHTLQNTLQSEGYNIVEI